MRAAGAGWGSGGEAVEMQGEQNGAGGKSLDGIAGLGQDRAC